MKINQLEEQSGCKGQENIPVIMEASLESGALSKHSDFQDKQQKSEEVQNKFNLTDPASHEKTSLNTSYELFPKKMLEIESEVMKPTAPESV